MDLDQVCSYDAPRVRTVSVLGVTSWAIGTKKTNFQKSFSESGRPGAVIFGT